MLLFILRRILLMIPTLLAITVISFVIIEAPPGDFIDVYVARITSGAQQRTIDPSEIAALRARYGLGQPGYVRYFRWLGAILQGDLGRSLEWNQPVAKLIADRLPWTLTISLLSFVIFIHEVYT